MPAALGKRSAQGAQRPEARGIAAEIGGSAATGDCSGKPGREATRPNPSARTVTASGKERVTAKPVLGDLANAVALMHADEAPAGLR